MDSRESYWTDIALLEWQIDLGVTEAICDAPIDRYALDPAPAKPAAVAPVIAAIAPRPPIPQPVQEVDHTPLAKSAAAAATDLAALARAVAGFTGSDLSKGARNTVFGAGLAAARVMFITDPPDREEDRAGAPLVGDAGRLFDNMLAAIGMDRNATTPDNAAYIAPAMPWRIAGDGMPSAADISLLKPFIDRHIALAGPDIVVLMGNTACQMLLGKSGLTQLRGHWAEVIGRPALAMLPPAHLLRNPAAKRDAWADLLALQARMKDTP